MGNIAEERSIKKLSGRVYTPTFIVKNILDLAGYCGKEILDKHIIDNSCGDGAFLQTVVDRYCQEFLKQSEDTQTLALCLSKFIHGIEIDNIECQKCRQHLNAVALKYNVYNVDWDIICADALKVQDYNGRMDFVVGNPPYIRVHNLGSAFNDIKKFFFSQNGMTDLYIVFYEIGLRMLNKSGVLGYITPSSFFSSVAGKYMRSAFILENLPDKIVDLKHFQAFTATTYSAIVILRKNRENKGTEYYEFDDKNGLPYYVDTLLPTYFYLSDKFYFSQKNKLKEL